jgi:hypothetical protein
MSQAIMRIAGHHADLYGFWPANSAGARQHVIPQRCCIKGRSIAGEWDATPAARRDRYFNVKIHGAARRRFHEIITKAGACALVADIGSFAHYWCLVYWWMVLLQARIGAQPTEFFLT